MAQAGREDRGPSGDGLLAATTRRRGCWKQKEDGSFEVYAPEEPEESYQEKTDRLMAILYKRRDEGDLSPDDDGRSLPSPGHYL